MNTKLLALAQNLNIPFIRVNSNLPNEDGEDYYFGITNEQYDIYLKLKEIEGEDEGMDGVNWFEMQDSYIDFENLVEVNGDYYTYEGEEYLILDDSEADERAIEYVEGVIEECYITKEMKDSWLYHYIDIEGAAESAVNQDGRGHHLAGYDGEEKEETLPNGETFYLYRTN